MHKLVLKHAAVHKAVEQFECLLCNPASGRVRPACCKVQCHQRAPSECMGDSYWPCLLENMIYARGLQKRPKAGLLLLSQPMLLISRLYCSATPVGLSTLANP